MPKYGNWFPKWILYTIYIGLLIFMGLSFLFITKGLTILSIIFVSITIVYILFTLKSFFMHKSFNYDDKNSISWRIIKYVATYVNVKPFESILDIGCGSGALTIECAKNNANAMIVGMDRWGAEYNAFSKEVCDKNAKEENVHNVEFVKGDIKKLTFNKESFDCIISNYVIHNVPGNKQEMLFDILSLLKKGGTFAIHDLFSHKYYGNIDDIITTLNDLGYEKVKFISTTKGSPMTKKEAKRLMLTESKILYGRK